MDDLTVRVFVVEDHGVMRGMLCEAVKRQDGCSLCGAAGSAEDALAELDKVEVDLVLVDVSLPQMSGVDLVRALARHAPDVRCLMISGHVEPGYAEQALAAGACGYVLKGRPEDLELGIREALAGRIFLSQPLDEKFDGEDDSRKGRVRVRSSAGKLKAER